MDIIQGYHIIEEVIGPNVLIKVSFCNLPDNSRVKFCACNNIVLKFND